MVRDREDSKPSNIFWGADIHPSYFALPAGASFPSSPEESTTPFVNGFNDAHRKGPSTHGVRKQGGKDRVDKEETTTYRKGTASPSREAHIPFGDNWGEVRETKPTQMMTSIYLCHIFICSERSNVTLLVHIFLSLGSQCYVLLPSNNS